MSFVNQFFVYFFHSELGHYMYVDSIYAKRFQEVAKLVSPMTTSSMAGCLSFYYQRDQAIGNFFSVFTKDQLGHYEEIWRPDVYATSNWKLVQVDIKAPHPLEVSNVFYVSLHCKTHDGDIRQKHLFKYKLYVNRIEKNKHFQKLIRFKVHLVHLVSIKK